MLHFIRRFIGLNPKIVFFQTFPVVKVLYNYTSLNMVSISFDMASPVTIAYGYPRSIAGLPNYASCNQGEWQLKAVDTIGNYSK